MDKYEVPNSIIHLFDGASQSALQTRLRILWHLWKRESIDSYAFNNTDDILFGMRTMLKNKVYSKNIIEQLEDKTLHYLFPDNGRVKQGYPTKRRYLLLQRLFSFIGDQAGISFTARYGYIEQTVALNLQEYRELACLENAVLNLYDFLASISVKDIKAGNFAALMK